MFIFQIVVHLLVRWSNQQYRSQRGIPASLRHEGEIPSRPVVFRRLWMFWIVLLAGTLAIASSVVPSSPSLSLVTGNGGPTAASRFCALPLLVARHFKLTNQAGHSYTASTVPTTTQLTTLPRPTAHGQVFYDPRTTILCAVNAVILRQAWFQITTVVSPTPTVIPTVVPATPIASPTSSPPSFPTSSNNLWSQGALDALSGIWTGFYHWAGQTIQYVEDWATETLGFMWVTPAALTYKNGIVQEGVNWMLSLMDGVIMLLLVIGGYQCIIRTVLGEPRQDVLAFVFRVLIAAVIANFGTLYLIPQLIEMNNTLCAGSLQVFLHTSAGDFTVPFFGGVNWLQQPLTWSLFLLIDFVLAVLLSLSLLVRFALFLVCYILAPTITFPTMRQTPSLLIPSFDTPPHLQIRRLPHVRKSGLYIAIIILLLFALVGVSTRAFLTPLTIPITTFNNLENTAFKPLFKNYREHIRYMYE